MGELTVLADWLNQASIPAAEARSATGEALGSRTLDIHISKRYMLAGKISFQLVSQFQVEPGVTILLGHSGAGKTTLLRCIAGLADMQEGRIAIGDRVFFDSSRKINLEPRQRNVAFVFQNLALFPHLTVEENVAYGLRKLSQAERSAKAGAIMTSFRISHLAKRLPGDVSGGEQQRVALARALVIEPAVLLLDEPLSSLDVCTKARIIEDLRNWNAERRIPIVYVTHDHEEVLALGERVITLEQGRIAAESSPLNAWAASQPASRWGSRPGSTPCENRFEATVVASQEAAGSMTCRLAGSTAELQSPLTSAAAGTRVHLAIAADDILISANQPDLLSDCNLIPGRLLRISRVGDKLQALVAALAPADPSHCLPDPIQVTYHFRVTLSAKFLGSPAALRSNEVWLMIPKQNCQMVRTNSSYRVA